jgi:pimeloyl-ACP methyl ester carboxylesterase
MRRLIAASMLMMVLLAGCSGADGDRAPNEASSSGAPTSQAALGEVNGKFDVGDYQLYLTCKGTGSPTVVYLHGLGGGGTVPEVMEGLAPRLTDRHRFCSYDRVNTGQSDMQQDQHTGADSVRDLHTLLAAADVRGPYLLLGWSYGGLVASMYAGTYPDDVMGILLLDSSLPNDDEVDALIPTDELAQLKVEWEAAEREDIYPTTLDHAKQVVRSIPDVPVTYMAAELTEYPPTWPSERMKTLNRAQQTEFVDQFSQGRLVPVKSSHDIGADQPELVVAEVQRIVSNS